MVAKPRLAAALALAAILVFGLLLRVRAANHDYISQWDEAYHALVAKNLTRHPLEPTLYEASPIPPDEGSWQSAHIWLHKPPVPLWLMAASIAAFGDRELVFRLPSVLLDSAAILLVFLLAAELFEPDGLVAGLIAAAFYAVNPLMIRLVSGRVPDDHAHLINAFFVTLTVLLFVAAAKRRARAWFAAAGASLGLGTLCMSAIALLGLAAPLPVLAAGPRKRAGDYRFLLPALAAFAATALPWPLYSHWRWPREARLESSLQLQHLLVVIDGHAHGPAWFLGLLPVQLGGVAWIAGSLALVSLLHAANRAARERAAGYAVPVLWVVLPYLFFSAIQTKMYSYVCVAMPAFCLLLGALGAAAWRRASRPPFLGARRLAAIAVLLALGAQFSGTAVQRWSADYHVNPWNGLYDYPALRAAALEIGRAPGPKIVFNVGDDKSPQVIYYAGCPAYPFAPSVNGLRYLLSRGYSVYFLTDESSPPAEALAAYRAAGILGKVSVIRLPKPREIVAVHPYEA